jgi:hypothetical protein
MRAILQQARCQFAATDLAKGKINATVNRGHTTPLPRCPKRARHNSLNGKTGAKQSA